MVHGKLVEIILFDCKLLKFGAWKMRPTMSEVHDFCERVFFQKSQPRHLLTGK